MKLMDGRLIAKRMPSTTDVPSFSCSFKEAFLVPEYTTRNVLLTGQHHESLLNSDPTLACSDSERSELVKQMNMLKFIGANGIYATFAARVHFCGARDMHS